MNGHDPTHWYAGKRVLTNTPPCGAFRGHGTVDVRFAFESLLDQMARQCATATIVVTHADKIIPTFRRLSTIRAERTPRSDEGVKWLAHERPSGSFLRQLNLGDGIATDQISANYDNGVLSVMIPVSEKAKPRKVAVTASTSVEPVAVES